MSRMPQVTAQELVRFLLGKVCGRRQTESHLTLWHEQRKVSVTVPIHTAAIWVGFIRAHSERCWFQR